METVMDFIFLGSKITADGDCAHDIKRFLLLGRKAMTNLDRVLKSRVITLGTKVHKDKAMVFLIVIYGCESCTIRMLSTKELRNWCFWTVVLDNTLESPLDCKEIKQVYPKEINPKYSLEGLMLKLKLQYFGHLMWRADSLKKNPVSGKDWRQEKKGTTEDETVGWHHWFNECEFEQAPGDGEGQGSLAWCSPWGQNMSDMTSDWTTTTTSLNTWEVTSAGEELNFDLY